HVSLQRCHDPAPPSLPRVPAGSVSRAQRYYEALRRLAARPTALRCLRLAVPWACLVVRSRPVPDTEPAGRGSLGSATPLGPSIPTETTSPPKFPGNPGVPAPCSWTPARPSYQAVTVGRHGPTRIQLRRLSTRGNFGAR